MSEPICPYCGDGMESVGTLNHIECVRALKAERDKADARFRAERRLRQKAESALIETLRHPHAKPQRLAEYAYRIEQAAAKYDAAAGL